jgi:DNA-binding GntR family transcriptional regulator
MTVSRILDTDPVGMPPTRAGAVADKLRRMITTGQLAPGAKLRQNDIAALLKVSTTPVREAFLLLVREGLVTQDAHRGVVVFAPSVEDVRENYEIRGALECLAMELATKQISAAELDQLDLLLEEMRVSLRGDTDYHTRVLNPRFHSLIYAAARRPKLIELINTLRDVAVVHHSLLVGTHVHTECLDEVQAEHEEIVAALRGRAPKRAARAIKVHIDNKLKQTLISLRDTAGSGS